MFYNDQINEFEMILFSDVTRFEEKNTCINITSNDVLPSVCGTPK